MRLNAQRFRSLTTLLAILPLLLLLSGCGAGQKEKQSKPAIPAPEQTDLFVSGQGDYSSYRIPALLTTQKGTVLAFVEGRKDSAADHGRSDILLRRSSDGGKTWGPVQLVVNDGNNCLNNPTAVVDRDTGTIWLALITTSTKKFKDDDAISKATAAGKGPISETWVMHSNDEGATWIGPTDITKSVNKPNWVRSWPGPGVGIQLRRGRLVIPCTHYIGAEATDHVFYSDDHAKTWHLGGSIEGNMDESQVVELTDGSLLFNLRNNRDQGHRGIAISKDSGMTWSPVTPDPTLIEPVCQASIIRYTEAPQFPKSRLLFSNPASQKDRNNFTVRVSYDEGKTWPVAKLLNAGPAGYSCLTVLPEMKIGCFYERGEHSSIEKVTFARFSLEWLTDGADSLQARGD